MYTSKIKKPEAGEQRGICIWCGNSCNGLCADDCEASCEGTCETGNGSYVADDVVKA